MSHARSLSISATAVALIATLALAQATAPAKPAAVPLYEGLGAFSRKVSTTSPEAQRYFNQGLAFFYAFNHDEAIRAFTRASEIDPTCAMAFWGIALANGPHINNTVVPEAHAKAAWDAVGKAKALANSVTPVEKGPDRGGRHALRESPA